MGATYSDAQKRASEKYLFNLDEIKVRMPKGQKEQIKAHAEVYDGGSVNAFIRRAITETIARDSAVAAKQAEAKPQE